MHKLLYTSCDFSVKHTLQVATNFYVEMVQVRLILMFVVHIVLSW